MLYEICDNIKTAIIHGRTDIIRSILDACEQNKEISRDQLLNTKVLPEGSFLSLATQLNQGDVVRNLLSSGADPNVCSAYQLASNSTMKQIYIGELLQATASSDVLRAGQMLDAGVDVNSWDSQVSQNTPLHWAVCYASKEMVSYLIGRGANVNALNSAGASPLHDAITRGDKEICVELVRAGADLYLASDKGKSTPISLAKKKPELLAAIENELHDVTSESDGSERRQETAKLLKDGQVEYSKEADNVNLQFLGRKRSYQNFHSDTEEANQASSYHKANSFDEGVGKGSEWTEGGRRRHISEGGGEAKAMTRGGNTVYSSQASSLDLLPRIEPMLENLHLSTTPRSNKSVVSNPNLHLLWPQPQSILELNGPGFTPQKQLYISVSQGSVSIHRVLDVWEISRPALLSLGYVVKIGDVQPSVSKFSNSPIECAVNSNLFAQDDAYQIHISANKIHMTASSERGLYYCILTFTQLLKLSLDCPLPSVVIRDHSRLRHRAVLLDISPRGRIPCLEYLLSLLDTLSSLKINYVHLYTRLLPSCDWQLCYSKSELVALDRQAQDRFISLVPVLDVDDTVTPALLDSMWPVLQEILTCFPNLTFIHLGPRLSSMVTQGKCDQLDDSDDVTSCCSHSANHSLVDSVLQSYVSLHRLALPASATIMLCANSLHSAKPPLPNNVVLLEYGFQADYDFRAWSKELQELGGIMGFCPGTASWNSLAGCPEAAIYNIYSAVQTAVEENGLGVVTAHWSGSHHLTPHPFAGPGFLLTAGLSWNPTTHMDYLQCSMGELLDAHILHDSAGVAGSAILELGYIETYVIRSSRNQSALDYSHLPDQEGSSLYKLLTDPDNASLDYFTQAVFVKVIKHVKKCQKDLLKAKLNCVYGDMILQETMLSADLMLTACRVGRALLNVGVNPNSNMGLAVINLGINNLPATFRTDIANKLLAHIEQYKGSWLQRHLPAGLQTSLLILTAALHRKRFKGEEVQAAYLLAKELEATAQLYKAVANKARIAAMLANARHRTTH